MSKKACTVMKKLNFHFCTNVSLQVKSLYCTHSSLRSLVIRSNVQLRKKECKLLPKMSLQRLKKNAFSTNFITELQPAAAFGKTSPNPVFSGLSLIQKSKNVVRQLKKKKKQKTSFGISLATLSKEIQVQNSTIFLPRTDY